MQLEALAPTAIPIVALAPRVEQNDERIVQMWLHGKPDTTGRTYRTALKRFQAYLVPLGSPQLVHVTLSDLQGFVDSLEGLADATRAKIISAIKSLYSFAHHVGYLQYNVAGVIEAPVVRNRLSERILTESEVITMIALEKNPRDRLILRVLYIAGLRVSELVGLRWQDLTARDNGRGQISVFGKGRKTRVILLPETLWAELTAHRERTGEAMLEQPVFAGRLFKKRPGEVPPLTTSQAWRIVKRAAARAGLTKKVSPHWMRHAHASHALDRGCQIHLLSDCLGHASLGVTSRYAHSRPGESSSTYLSS